jgi:chemotaxis protein MotB
MSDDTQQPIIVKKIKKGGGGAHGGAWKIAYADFVTAMMAFFLLMWLLGSTTQGDLKGIAEYFENPLKVAHAGRVRLRRQFQRDPGRRQGPDRQTGQVKYGDGRSAAATSTCSQLEAENEERNRRNAERAKLVELKSQIEARIEANPTCAVQNQLVLDLTAKACASRSSTRRTGRCSIVRQRPVQALHLGHPARDRLILNQVDNRIFLSGHTDARRLPAASAAFPTGSCRPTGPMPRAAN